MMMMRRRRRRTTTKMMMIAMLLIMILMMMIKCKAISGTISWVTFVGHSTPRGPRPSQQSHKNENKGT